MNFKLAQNLCCPIDGEPLQLSTKQLVCSNGHTYDVARQGYVNLLPVQQKKSRQPGDSKEMVCARTRFLDSGVYEPVADKLDELAFSYMHDKNNCILDAGCGEGYYLDHFYKYLQHKNKHCDETLIGLDISKFAIIASTKRNKQITWIVGTNKHPPVISNTLDIVFCIFGFPSFEAFSNTLKTGGKVILVEPGPEHLKELRQIIYPKIKEATYSDYASIENKGFSLLDTYNLKFNTGAINNIQILDLLSMTPHFYRATKEGRDAAAKLETLDLTVEVVFNVLKKG